MTTITIWDDRGNFVEERRFEIKAEGLAWAHSFMRCAPGNYSFNTYTE